MKKIIILAALSTARAETIDGRVKIEDVKIERQGELVNVQYTVTVAPRAVKRGYTLLLGPAMTDNAGQYTQSLPAVVIRGKGAGIAHERGEWVSGLTESRDVTTLTNGRRATLTATVPFQEWMYDSWLLFSADEGGCCRYTVLDDVLLSTGMAKPEPRPMVVEAVPEPPVWEPVTVADSLSTAFTFVLPASEYDEKEPFKIYDDERENALVVYFHVGKYDIVPGYMDNARTLSNLSNVIRMIMTDDGSQVERVVVAGFASPEGGFELNDRLAFDRAVSVKEYIMKETGLADGRIQLHNGSVDWRGLRAMVARSALPEKQQILSVIDNTPIWDSRGQTGRLEALKRLDGGRPYRYLLNEYFPYLRSGAFIRVYYDNNK